MIIGAILQATSFGYAQMIVARIVTGLGNGLNVKTIPAFPFKLLMSRDSDFHCAFLSCRMLARCETRKLDYG